MTSIEKLERDCYRYQEFCDCKGDDCKTCYITEAIDALKSRTPMKPNSKYDFRYNCNVCPICETETTCRMLFPWEKYCPDCGQAIDWEET